MRCVLAPEHEELGRRRAARKDDARQREGGERGGAVGEGTGQRLVEERGLAGRGAEEVGVDALFLLAAAAVSGRRRCCSGSLSKLDAEADREGALDLGAPGEKGLDGVEAAGGVWGGGGGGRRLRRLRGCR